MTWMLTATGAQLDLRFLRDDAISLLDIAHHLSQINRFTGACSRPYSVAEHSMLVERIGAARGASPGLRLALLMHDAHEAYTSDLASPAKISVGTAWRSFEAHHALNVRHHFGMRTAFTAWRKEIDLCDRIALATERRDLMPYDPGQHDPWPILDTPGQEVPCAQEHIDPDEPPLAWRAMRDAFINRYLMLREQQQAQHRTTATA